MIENYYRILGLDNFASVDEVKKAYRLLAKKYHPDRDPSKEDIFKRVNEANSILSDASKKELYDDKLKYSLNPSTTQQHQTFRQAKPRYNQPKYEYSKKVKFYGALFVFSLIGLCIGGPIALSFYSSSYAYEEGLRFQKAHNFRDAVASYNRAIKYFSTKSGLAGIQLSRLYLYNFKSPNGAIKYVNEALDYTDKNDERAELYFIKAKALKEDGQTELSKTNFLKARKNGYSIDSTDLNIGMLEAFYFNSFDSAIFRFDNLINRQVNSEEAYFGKAWCLQKNRKHNDAIVAFDLLIENYPENGPGHYYKGLSELTLGDSTAACNSIKKANELNYPLASKIIEFVCL